MTTPYSSARKAYAESAVLTASPERLVVMLYDGAIRSLRQSADAMRKGERERSRSRMRAGELIIDELNGALDMGQGQIASQLRAIYHYCKRLLIQANTETDAPTIDTVVRLLSELRDAWAEIEGRSSVRPA